MDVWRLETDTNSTNFNFPIEEDKSFFHELVKQFFEQSKPVSEKWRLLYLLRSEPRKQVDFFEIDETDVIAISQNAVDILKAFLNEKVELLPIETDAGRYYALNVLNFVDCLDKAESDFVATKGGTIVSHSLLEFKQEKLKGNGIFKIPELPYDVFVTGDFQELCEDEYLRGLVFDTTSNLVWYPT
jgi:hypothetical protein